MQDLPKLVELQVPVTLNDVLKKWSHQTGCFDKSVSTEIRERLYTNALMSLFCLFAKYHTELNDGDFVRCFRFFKDSGLTKRLSDEAHVSERYLKLEHQEPGIPEIEKPKPADPPLTEKDYNQFIESTNELLSKRTGII